MATIGDPDWTKRGAVAQIVGVIAMLIIGAATLFLMWWLAAHPPTATVPTERPVPIASWMPLLIAVSMILTGLLLFFGMRNGKRINQAVAKEKKEPISPLHIVSARWGIGGDAYKDVTEIVRSHAKPDSVSVPASAGLFGDPYPNTPKQLRVVYSFARQWEVSIKESENLTLPEKLGEEEGNPAQYRERLDALLAKEGEVDRILGSGISDTEYSLFVKVKAAFLALRLCDKVALCRICKAGTISSIELKISLTADGFERPEKSIEILLSKDLVEVPGAGTGIGSGMIRARDPKWVDALLSDNPISLC